MTCALSYVTSALSHVTSTFAYVTNTLSHVTNTVAYVTSTLSHVTNTFAYIIIITDRFYIALFSALEQTHCAHMTNTLST